ncbi:MAG: carboxypeptidase M32 [Elusimicrobiales bacterium]|nr:carboxypeptidase M32 [Elusimicrobiales bacterium]
MEKKFSQLRRKYEEVAALGSAASVLGWDQRVYMPPKGAEARGRALAALEETLHVKFTAPETGALIAELYDWAQARGGDSFEAAYLRALKRDYDKAVKLPAAFVSEFSLACTAAYEAWHKAKQASDFSVFAPHLEKMLQLNLRKAAILDPKAAPYDALLDIYEPGMTRARLDAIFAELLAGLKPVIKAIAAKSGKVSDAPFRGDFDPAAQLRLADELVKALGFDFDRGRQDRSPHPFTTGGSINDIRITTRAHADWLPACVYASIHECGHALYELGSPQDFEFTPLAGGASLGMHESQSRFWENVVGRSRPFAAWALPLYRKHFPGKFDNLTPEDLYRAANKSAPSLVRVEADEVTYNLHIALRYEIETMLLDGSLKVKDAPAMWNSRMKDYLGIAPANDAEGILQDVHWSQGTLGYFPTYTLGNLAAAQLFNAMKRDLGDTDALVARGEFAPLLAWLGGKIHVHGRKYLPEELLQRAIGEKLSVGPFVDYIKAKYSEIYGF